MATDRTYTTGQVARALGIPVRRLKGWVEKGLLSPRVLRGRTRRGDRRAYSWRDVFAAAILAEFQRLLGTSNFRPSGVAKLVAEQLRSREFSLLLDVVPPGSIFELSASDGRPALHVLHHASLDHVGPVAVVVRLARLARQVKEALDREVFHPAQPRV